ncbi:MAG: CHASE2 domain-containing protein, partial [Candidatus Latescibacteria bacterium]|nr:CHASE2 domain-containing protein [Candidatus Latescibacterota bacterium]
MVVGITHECQQDPLVGTLPLPRAKYADAIEKLNDLGASVICFDIFFPETDDRVNNAALAAQRLCREGAVAILDIDYHHGNGTQEIFYVRDDVFYASIHAHPGYAYPGCSGHAEETGFGAGAGHNHNRPLGPGTGDGEFLPELSGALERITDFQPEFLIVSLGTDIADSDPIADWRVSAGGFSRAGKMIAGTALPT